jgi:hypothetical protein
MRFIQTALLSCAAALALVACSATPTRTVSGQLTLAAFHVDNPVVVAESSDRRVFIATVSAQGAFSLQLPANAAYRVTLAETTVRPGIYDAVARIDWPLATGAVRWAKLSPGAPLDLGTITLRGSTTAAQAPTRGLTVQCESCGGASGSADDDQGDKDKGAKDKDKADKDKDHGKAKHHGDSKEDDKAGVEESKHEKDCDCSKKIDKQDGCDKDDHADEHEQACDHDNHDKTGNHDDDDDQGENDDDQGKSGSGKSGSINSVDK